MAIREIRTDDDLVLRKMAREVERVNSRINILIDDMFETMYQADGIGLAAPQVGVLRRVVVVDIDEKPFVFINPKIVCQEGKQCNLEGCLSIPGKTGEVERPRELKIEYTNRKGKKTTMEAEGLLARVICHELDHLNGVLFIDRVVDLEE
ncbi:MAG: peptide deformylase [Alkaliphilus sp.]